MEFVARDFEQHEALIGIEAFFHVFRRAKVARHQLAGIPQDEVIDGIDRLQSLVHMLVPRKDGIYTIFFEQRGQPRAQIEVRTVIPAIRVERVVEVAEFPSGIDCMPGFAEQLSCFGSM